MRTATRLQWGGSPVCRQERCTPMVEDQRREERGSSSTWETNLKIFHNNSNNRIQRQLQRVSSARLHPVPSHQCFILYLRPQPKYLYLMFDYLLFISMWTYSRLPLQLPTSILFNMSSWLYIFAEGTRDWGWAVSRVWRVRWGSLTMIFIEPTSGVTGTGAINN